jgi:hypothetical protein
VAGVGGREFGVAAHRQQSAHFISCLPARYFGATLYNSTRYFQARNHTLHVAAASVFALAQKHIGAVYAGRVHLNQHLVGGGHGPGLLVELQYLRATCLSNGHSFHLF